MSIKQAEGKCVVEVSNIPVSMADKTLNMTVEMVQSILELLQLDGNWKISVVDRQRKKADERFRAIRCQSNGNGVVIRCKPGGNDTCYLWQLHTKTPTGSYETLLRLLQQIHPKRLTLPTVASHGSLMSSVEPVPKLPSIQRTVKVPSVEKPASPKVVIACGFQSPTNGQPCGKEVVEVVEAVDGQKVATCEQHQKTDIWKEIKKAIAVEIEKRKPKEPKIEKPDSEHLISTLELNFRHGGRVKIELLPDEEALNKAIVAAAFVMQQDGRAIKSHIADSIIHELKLKKPSHDRGGHSLPMPADMARVLTSSLTKAGLIERFQYRKRTTTGQKTAVEGCQITPQGREKISALMEIMSDELTSRLWNGSSQDQDDEDINESEDIPAPKSLDPHPTGLDERFVALDQAGILSRVRPLMDEYDSLLQAISDQSTAINEFKRELRPEEIYLFGIDRRIDELEKEVEELKADKEKRKKELEDRKVLIEEYAEELSQMQTRIALIQAQIKENMASFSAS